MDASRSLTTLLSKKEEALEWPSMPSVIYETGAHVLCVSRQKCILKRAHL